MTDGAAKVWDVLIKATVPVSIVIGSALIAHEVRIAKLEDSRFTTADAYQLEHRVVRALEAKFPQPWLLDDLREIKDRLKSIEARLPTKGN